MKSNEGFFTKIGAIAAVIGAIATVIGVVVAVLSWQSPEGPSEPPPPQINKNEFDEKPLYTISSGAILEVTSDIHIPANKDILYIQAGQTFLEKEKVDDLACLCLLEFETKSSQIRTLTSGTSLKVTDSSKYGSKERDFWHSYVYLHVDNEEIKYVKCIGKDDSNQITIGEFKEVTQQLFKTDIPIPKVILTK